MSWPFSALVAGLILMAAAVFVMLGLGGAMVFVPLLHWLGFELQTVAIPLGLVLNTVNTGLALRHYTRRGLVDWRGIWPLTITVVITAPMGALTVPYTNQDLLLGLFAGALVVSAGVTLARIPAEEGAVPEGSSRRRRIALGGAGVAVGFVSGLLGLGGGFIVAPLLLVLGYSAKAAAASSAMVVTFSSLAGALGHLGHSQFPLLLTAIAIGSVAVGSVIGTRLMVERASPLWLGRAYAVLLLLIAVRLGWESLA